MSINIIDSSVFTDPVTAPADDDDADEATFLAGLQALANRTRFLLDNPAVPALAVDEILARASTGPSEGKASSDYSLAQIAQTGAREWSDGLDTKGADIASATTTNLATVTGTYVTVNGTTTIDSFGTANPGVRRWVRFTASLILTHSANLILPGAVNITTVAEDMLLAISEGGGVWRVASYIGQGADVQSVTAAAGQNILQASPTMGAVVLTPLNQEIETTLANTHYGLNAGNVGSYTTANRNASFGEGANAATVTGDDNTSVGYFAFNQAVANAGQNTMVGAFAGSTLRGAGENQPVNNVGVGFEALMGAGAAEGVNLSTGVGYRALKNVDGAGGTSNNNTAFGGLAGTAVTTGQHLTLLGAAAGSTITTGSNDIIIGRSQTTPSPTDSDHLNIGGTIYGDLSTDRIRFGGTGLVVGDASLRLSQTDSSFVPNVLDDTQEAALTPIDGMFHYSSTAGMHRARQNGAWVDIFSATLQSAFGLGNTIDVTAGRPLLLRGTTALGVSPLDVRIDPGSGYLSVLEVDGLGAVDITAIAGQSINLITTGGGAVGIASDGTLGFGSTSGDVRLNTGGFPRLVIANAGNVSIGGSGVPNAAAELDLTSAARGFLTTRWTTAQETANLIGLGIGEKGLAWFNTTTNAWRGWNGTMAFTFGANGGEANTASNQGAGADIFLQKTGVDLEFRGLTGIGGITAVVNGSSIDLSGAALLSLAGGIMTGSIIGQAISSTGFTGNLTGNVNGVALTDVGSATDFLNAQGNYVDPVADGPFLPLAGGTMSGQINMLAAADIKFAGGAGNNFLRGNVLNTGRVSFFTDNVERLSVSLTGVVNAISALHVAGVPVVVDTRAVIAGDGLLGGGDFSENRTFDVALTADAQHGTRGGGTQHADVVAGGASGFMDGVRATKVDALVVSEFQTTGVLFDGTNPTRFLHTSGAGVFQTPTGATLTIPASAPTGTYDVSLDFEWGYNTTASNFLSQLLQSGVGIPIMEHLEEPADSGGSGGVVDGAAMIMHMGRELPIDFTTGTAVTFTFQFAPEAAFDCAVRRVSLSVERKL